MTNLTEENVIMWEKYLASLEVDHRWRTYELALKSACARYREQHLQQGELE